MLGNASSSRPIRLLGPTYAVCQVAPQALTLKTREGCSSGLCTGNDIDTGTGTGTDTALTGTGTDSSAYDQQASS